MGQEQDGTDQQKVASGDTGFPQLTAEQQLAAIAARNAERKAVESQDPRAKTFEEHQKNLSMPEVAARLENYIFGEEEEDEQLRKELAKVRQHCITPSDRENLTLMNKQWLDKNATFKTGHPTFGPEKENLVADLKKCVEIDRENYKQYYVKEIFRQAGVPESKLEDCLKAVDAEIQELPLHTIVSGLRNAGLTSTVYDKSFNPSLPVDALPTTLEIPSTIKAKAKEHVQNIMDADLGALQQESPFLAKIKEVADKNQPLRTKLLKQFKDSTKKITLEKSLIYLLGPKDGKDMHEDIVAVTEKLKPENLKAAVQPMVKTVSNTLIDVTANETAKRELETAKELMGNKHRELTGNLIALLVGVPQTLQRNVKDALEKSYELSELDIKALSETTKVSDLQNIKDKTMEIMEKTQEFPKSLRLPDQSFYEKSSLTDYEDLIKSTPERHYKFLLECTDCFSKEVQTNQKDIRLAISQPLLLTDLEKACTPDKQVLKEYVQGSLTTALNQVKDGDGKPLSQQDKDKVCSVLLQEINEDIDKMQPKEVVATLHQFGEGTCIDTVLDHPNSNRKSEIQPSDKGDKADVLTKRLSTQFTALLTEERVLNDLSAEKDTQWGKWAHKAANFFREIINEIFGDDTISRVRSDRLEGAKRNFSNIAAGGWPPKSEKIELNLEKENEGDRGRSKSKGPAPDERSV